MNDNLYTGLGKIAGKQPEAGAFPGIHLFIEIAGIRQAILDLAMKSVPPIESDVGFFGFVHADGGCAEAAVPEVGKNCLHQT